MNRIHGICFVLILFIAGSFAIGYDCRRVRCGPFNPATCRHGVTTGPCGICHVCYKIFGEECGGPLDRYGVCIGSLFCYKPKPVSGGIVFPGILPAPKGVCVAGMV